MKFRAKAIYFGVLFMLLSVYTCSILTRNDQSKNDQARNVIDDELVNNPREVLEMKISVGGIYSTVKDTFRIQKFLRILKSCKTQLPPRNTNVEQYYKVELFTKDEMYECRFQKKSATPFMRIVGTGAHSTYYECKQMESFLIPFK